MDIRQDCVFLVSNEHDCFLASITKPTKAHFHSFGSVLYNCVSADYVGGNIFKLNWCWNLVVAHFMYVIVKGHIIFSVD